MEAFYGLGGLVAADWQCIFDYEKFAVFDAETVKMASEMGGEIAPRGS